MNTYKPVTLFFATVLAMSFSGCNKKPSMVPMKKTEAERSQKRDVSPCVTVMIHGTLALPNGIALTKPLYSALSRYLGTPLGLKHWEELEDHAFVELAHILNRQAPQEFPLSSFYFFGWPGGLDAHLRKNASIALYDELKALNLPPNARITLLTHSHAGNISLYLDEVVREKNDPTFTIDRLILMACPVQDATEKYIASPLFNKIYNIYSPGDLVQVIDPQGMQGKRHNKAKTFFSRRVFQAHSNLLQAEIQHNTRAPGHLAFIKPDFMKALPSILKILDNPLTRSTLPLSTRDTLCINLKHIKKIT